MNIKHCFLIILLISWFKVNAQKVYKTEEGHIMLMAMVDNVPTKAESHKLALYLDYNTKVVNGVLDLKSLSTNSPEINAVLETEEETLKLRFTGIIPSDDFLSKQHEPINFNWVVTVTYKDNVYKSAFKATLTHFDQGTTTSCLISARGQVLTSDTGLNELLSGLDETLEVQFAQLVLKLDKQ